MRTIFTIINTSRILKTDQYDLRNRFLKLYKFQRPKQSLIHIFQPTQQKINLRKQKIHKM